MSVRKFYGFYLECPFKKLCDTFRRNVISLDDDVIVRISYESYCYCVRKVKIFDRSCFDMLYIELS